MVGMENWEIREFFSLEPGMIDGSIDDRPGCHTELRKKEQRSIDKAR